jgi:lysophospholipase L1-like esterase
VVGRWLVAALLLAGPALAGCQDARPSGGEERYVALGDSFTSGAGLARSHPSAFTCGQSPSNYPHLVAKAMDVHLTDVSCSGASTVNGTEPQAQGPGAQPRAPQLDAVTRDTDVVTVGLGGNDFSWFLGVMFSCTSIAGTDPAGSPCQHQATSSGSDLTALPPRIGARLEALLEDVHRRAPGARVLLVGYPQPVPAAGTCRELPLASGDYPFVRAQWEAMGAAMRRAAAAARATFVDVLAASEGHDICAGADAWLNGFQNRPGVAAAYHPLARGQAAVAELVEQALRQ